MSVYSVICALLACLCMSREQNAGLVVFVVVSFLYLFSVL